MIKEPTLMICNKSFVDDNGDGVAKGAEYWVISYNEDLYYVFDNKENCSTIRAYRAIAWGALGVDGYIGKIPVNKFITLGQFREIRMKNILD